MALWLRYGKRQRDPSSSHEDAHPFALFFAMAVAQTLSGLLYLDSGNGLGMDFSWFSWMTLAALFTVSNCGFHFLCRVQGHPRPRLARALNRYCALAVIVALPWWWPAHSAAMPLLRLSLLPPVLLVVWVTLSEHGVCATGPACCWPSGAYCWFRWPGTIWPCRHTGSTSRASTSRRMPTSVC